MKTISDFQDSLIVWIQWNSTLWPMAKCIQLQHLNKTNYNDCLRWRFLDDILQVTKLNVEKNQTKHLTTFSINTLPSTKVCNVHIQPYTHGLDWWDIPDWHVLVVKTLARFVLLRPLQDILLLFLLSESHTSKDKRWQVTCTRWRAESCKSSSCILVLLW